MKRGDLIELEIEKYAFEGKGIAKVDKEKISNENPPKEGPITHLKYVVFVEGSYPGDKVKAKLTKIKKSFAEAKAVEILNQSEYRINPSCNFFGTCGGCKQQDLDYKIQLKYKQDQVEEILRRMGGFR